MIHTVGPIWRGGNQGEPELLAACYRNSLTLAKAQNCDSVAFPMISTGIYGYPKAAALQIAVHEVTTFLKENDMTVFLIVFSAESMGIAGKLFGNIKAYIDDVYAETHDDRESRRSIVDNRSAASAPKKNRFGILPLPQERKPSLAEDRSTPPPTMDKLSADSDFLFTLPEKPLLSLDEMLAQMDEGFPAMLLRKIDERQMTDSECYKRANIDRRLFNKIKNNPGYRPGKQTVLTFAVALRLSLEETKEMLSKAGYSLTHSSKSDIVVEYCILNKIYDIVEINQVLFGFDLQLLGY